MIIHITVSEILIISLASKSNSKPIILNFTTLQGNHFPRSTTWCLYVSTDFITLWKPSYLVDRFVALFSKSQSVSWSLSKFKRIDDFQKSRCKIGEMSEYSIKRKLLVKSIHKRGHFFKITTWKNDESDRRKWVENSFFGKVSLFSGRSWDYYKNKILNTYFPTPQTQSII